MGVDKLDVTLPSEMVTAIRERVESGAFASSDEVLEAAVQQLLDTEDDREVRLAEIRAEIQRRLNDPRPPLSSTEMRDFIDGLVEKHRATID